MSKIKNIVNHYNKVRTFAKMAADLSAQYSGEIKEYMINKRIRGVINQQSSSICPSWKSEWRNAMILNGKDPDSEEIKVRNRTTPTISSTLVIDPVIYPISNEQIIEMTEILANLR